MTVNRVSIPIHASATQLFVSRGVREKGNTARLGAGVGGVIGGFGGALIHAVMTAGRAPSFIPSPGVVPIRRLRDVAGTRGTLALCRYFRTLTAIAPGDPSPAFLAASAFRQTRGGQLLLKHDQSLGDQSLGRCRLC